MSQHREIPATSALSAQQVLTTLKEHGRVIVLSWLLLAMAGIVAISLMPNVYRARTTILVDPQKIPERYVSSTVTSDPNERLNTLTQQVLSASRLQEIVDRLHLYPQYRNKMSREELLDFIRAKTTIELKQGADQGLSSFSISYEDQDRWLVAPVANELASGFIDWNLKVRQQQALGTSEFLSSELVEAKKSLVQQEAALQAFRVQHLGATPDQLDGNLQALSRLQAELQADGDAISRLDQERILLSQVKEPETRETRLLTEREKVLQEKHRLETELSSLKRQFTDTYPDVVAVTSELQTVNSRLAAMPEPPPGSTDSYDQTTQIRLKIIAKELQRRQQLQSDVQGRINSYQGRVDSVPVLETQLAELTRNYEVSKQNYQSLLDKTFSAGMAQDLEQKQQAERFQVLDSAKTPEKPIRPKRLPFFAGAIVVSLLLSCGTVVGLDILKGAVKSEAELKTVLPMRIPVLGTIPPIVSAVDVRRSRMMLVQTAVVCVIASIAFVVFLLRVRPIL